MRGLIVTLLFISLSSWAMSSDDGFTIARSQGFDPQDIQTAYKNLYGNKWWCFLVKHFRYPSQAIVDLRSKNSRLNEEKAHLESIRPRPAAQLIPCDNQLLACALLLDFFSRLPGEECDTYEDEDD